MQDAAFHTFRTILGAHYDAPPMPVLKRIARPALAAPTADSFALIGVSHRRAPAAPKKIDAIATRAEFDKLATSATGAGNAGMPEVKFLIDRETQKVYFIPKEYPYHFTFAEKVLGYQDGERAFLRDAYVRDDRRYIAGTVVAFDTSEAKDGKKGVYGMSFWSTDILHAPMIIEAAKLVDDGLKFVDDKIVYHPLGQTQEDLLAANRNADKKALDRAGIPILTNVELAKSFTYMPLNTGKSFGTLRFVKGAIDPAQPLTRRDIALFAGNPPADLPPLAGIATSQPQTFLSHNALKARQDKTPYVYARDILNDPKIKALEGKLVSFEIGPTGYVIKEAAKAEADRYFESLRPKKVQEMKPDLSVRQIKALDDIHFADSRAYGSKTCNVAELHHLHKNGLLAVTDPRLGEPEVIAPDGFGIPMRFHSDFMNKGKFEGRTTFAQRRDQMLSDRTFKTDVVKRNAMLAELQERMEDAAMPASLKAQLDALKARYQAKFPDEEGIRIRSSSNSEDLKGFNGAGLFDSYTYRFDDDRPTRTFERRTQKVLGSVWNERAFAELDFYRIKPSTVAMAELVIPNEEGELANGVVRWGGAIPGWDTITINAGVGENLVTNPENGATPDAIVVANYGFNGEAEIQYEGHTNQDLLPGRKNVLTQGEIMALYKSMKVVQNHFKKLYGKENDPTFSIECEFKITKEGQLLIKQARPWVG